MSSLNFRSLYTISCPMFFVISTRVIEISAWFFTCVINLSSLNISVNGNEVVNLKRFYAWETMIKLNKLNWVYRQFPNASFANKKKQKKNSTKTRISNQGIYYSLLKLDTFVGTYTQLNNSTNGAMKSETGMWGLPQRITVSACAFGGRARSPDADRCWLPACLLRRCQLPFSCASACAEWLDGRAAGCFPSC